MSRSVVIFDFETVSGCDLKAAGAWKYAESPTTNVLCLCWQVEPGTVPETWVPGEPVPVEWAALVAEGSVFAAHNAAFEKAIYRKIMEPLYGWPPIPDEQWHDTMAVCAMKAIPQMMGQAVRVMGLPAQKDDAASKLTIDLSKTKAVKGSPKGYFPDPALIMQTVVIPYCQDDVRAQRGLHRRMGWLTPRERDIWLLDQTINQRGMRLDIPLVQQMQRIVDDATVPLAEEFHAITGCNFGQIAAVKDWCYSKGLFLPKLDKEAVSEALGVDPDSDEFGSGWSMPDDVRRALRIRQLVGSAAVKKLFSAQACVMADGRARGLVQYYGAATGRWSGRLLQPHNFPKGSLKEDDETPDPEPLVAALMTGDWRYVEALYGPAVEVVVSALRHILLADRGRTLVAGDLAGIELAVNLALAGAHEKCAMLAAGQSAYLDLANQIYAPRIITKADVEEYRVGKSGVLGLGFGMGPPKFQTKYARHMPIDFCERVTKVFREEWAPELVTLQRGLQNAALKTVWDRRPNTYAGVCYALEDGWMTARLPSGRKLWYRNPQGMRETMPWSDPEEPDVRRGWRYQAQKAGHWVTPKAFGGLLAENVVQGLARDLLVEGMFKCEAEGLPIILTVHDEVVCEVDEARADAEKVLDECMRERPQWAIEMGVPVSISSWTGNRYRK